MTSAAIGAALSRHHRLARAAYQDHLEAAVSRAEDVCRGNLLNARGRAKGVDPSSLFMGTEARANAYASDELRDHWAEYPRITWREWEAAYTEGWTP